MREGFNFYRSYAAVAARLSDEDRLAFYDALVIRQFTGKPPTDLPTMALFAYESQRHSIDKQVVGYEKSKNVVLTELEGCDILPTPLPPRGSPTLPSKEVQVEGEVQGKEEVKEEYRELLDFLNSTVGKKYRTISSAVKSAINARLKEGFTFDDFKTAITNASKDKYHRDNNYQWLTLEYISRPDQFEKWLNVSVKVEPTPIVLSKEQELKEIEEWIANPDNHEFKGTDPYDTDRVKVFLTHTAGNLGHDLLKKKLKRHLELTERL